MTLQVSIIEWYLMLTIKLFLHDFFLFLLSFLLLIERLSVQICRFKEGPSDVAHGVVRIFGFLLNRIRSCLHHDSFLESVVISFDKVIFTR